MANKTENPPGRTPPPSKHQSPGAGSASRPDRWTGQRHPAIKFADGGWLGDPMTPVRPHVRLLATIAVPIVICGLMPYLDRSSVRVPAALRRAFGAGARQIAEDALRLRWPSLPTPPTRTRTTIT